MTTNAERPTAGRPRRESRHRAREAAIQMLYQWEVGRSAIEDVARTFWMQAPRAEPGRGAQAGDALSEPLRQFATELAGGVARSIDEIDPIIAQAAEHWRLERMAIIDRLILRLAVYEFRHQAETPARVIINEALELARTFSTDEAVRFINGILDGIRRSSERE